MAFFLPPPEPDFGLPPLAEGAPFGDDDDRGSFVVEGVDSEDGNSFWVNWTLARFFGEGILEALTQMMIMTRGKGRVTLGMMMTLSIRKVRRSV